MMSEAKFQKHNYGKQAKHQVLPLESFDPRPEEYRGTASASGVVATKGRGLCMSLIFDKSTRLWKQSHTAASTNLTAPAPLEYNIVSKQIIEAEVELFKTLAVSELNICRIEKETREQRDCLKWFQARAFTLLLRTLVKYVDEEFRLDLMRLFCVYLELSHIRARTRCKWHGVGTTSHMLLKSIRRRR